MALLADIWAPMNPIKGGSMITMNHGMARMTRAAPPSPPSIFARFDGTTCWKAMARMANPKTADTKFVRSHAPFRPRHTCPRAGRAGASVPPGRYGKGPARAGHRPTHLQPQLLRLAQRAALGPVQPPAAGLLLGPEEPRSVLRRASREPARRSAGEARAGGPRRPGGGGGAGRTRTGSGGQGNPVTSRCSPPVRNTRATFSGAFAK